MGQPETTSSSRNLSSKLRLFGYSGICLVVIVVATLGLLDSESLLALNPIASTGTSTVALKSSNFSMGATDSALPKPLLDLGVYHDSDFVNEIGRSPPFWKTDPAGDSGQTWGPCYPSSGEIDWIDDRNSSKYVFRHNNKRLRSEDTSGGGCRPGFLIIGAGKCGTSSLYHYLLGHPRVAPAYSKQIHYFTYHLDKSMGWYYEWFPTPKSFLSHGALMTGEASPGYLPYPKTVKAVHELLPGGPKILMVGRNPLTRMYSSYKYNYVVPVVQRYSAGHSNGIPKKPLNASDDFYDPYLFTFEELVLAELDRLDSCFNDFGPKAARDRWYSRSWTKTEFDRREKLGLDPLIDLDADCYGSVVNKTVLRPQWAELQMAHPERFIPPNTAFLIQSLIGRSLYVFPLEWWYIKFDPADIIFVCTEELSDPDVLNDISMKMGLPSFDYTDVVGLGAFNVGSHRGYDTVTAWDQLEEEGDGNSQTSEEGGEKDHVDNIPLSEETRKKVEDFIRPYNERLFNLVGKRCAGW
eukprot:Nitzschia sp. Nitz4//scaffold257_size48314//12704//14368//NITZ4_007087-RA/size48314-processed-gene-0.42-mRNA-1//-1//CDS//3329544442//5289//frame0